MPRIQSQMVETPGTQVSASDDFDAEAQARLEELLKQARASVENKAKMDCQFKADLDKNKQGVTNRRSHLLRTHQEELHQFGKGLGEEVKGFAEEEADVLARLNDLLEGNEEDKGCAVPRQQGQPRTHSLSCSLSRTQNLGKLVNELENAAAELTQVDTGCLDVWQTFPDSERMQFLSTIFISDPDLTCLVSLPRDSRIAADERAISAKFLGERIDPSELDSGRNVGELPEGAISDEDPLAREDLEMPDIEKRHSATKKRTGGRNRR